MDVCLAWSAGAVEHVLGGPTERHRGAVPLAAEGGAASAAEDPTKLPDGSARRGERGGGRLSWRCRGDGGVRLATGPALSCCGCCHIVAGNKLHSTIETPRLYIGSVTRRREVTPRGPPGTPKPSVPEPPGPPAAPPPHPRWPAQPRGRSTRAYRPSTPGSLPPDQQP